MKNRDNAFAGTMDVYRFTFHQMVKGPANLIMLFIMLAIAAAVPPVMAMLGGETKTEKSEITSVYVQNESGYPLSLEEDFSETPYFADTVVSDTELTEETYGEALGETEVYIHLKRAEENGALELKAFTLENTKISESDLAACTQQITEVLDQARYQKLEAEEAQIALLMSGYTTDTQDAEEYLNPQEHNTEGRFSVQMVYSIAVIMLCTFTSAFVIQKVVEEKASKLTEMLMISVKPLALLAGKILAVMTYIFGELLILAAAFGISVVLTEKYTGVEIVGKLLASMQIDTAAFRISAGTAVILLISLLLGYLTVSFLSGLLGASCSSMEEVEPANMVVVLIVLAGYMAAVITMPLDAGTGLAAAVSLIPVVSIFCAPARYIVGDISFVVLALSWALQILVLVLLGLGCARIYRDLMLYRGNRMKIGRLISMMGKGGTRK